MSEPLEIREAAGRVTAVLPAAGAGGFPSQWAGLRARLVRGVGPGFTRDEWAYLMGFLDAGFLEAVRSGTFGALAPDRKPSWIARPRSQVALWLPSNVTLLGPLTLVLLSLTGTHVRLKASSSGSDLATSFLAMAQNHLAPGALRDWLQSSVTLDRFERDDPRNAQMAARADVRIVFGSDEAAQAVNALPHPPDSVQFSFTERYSEAWVERSVLTQQQDKIIDALVRVAAVYGQAGCTSPKRVVLIDGSASDARALCDGIAARWAAIAAGEVAPHLASHAILARQHALALGWHAVATAGNAAVIAAGAPQLPPFDNRVGLSVVHATAEQAFASLPRHVQTIGHALQDATDDRWLRGLQKSRILRWVPIRAMHQFSPTWDGFEFWRGLWQSVAYEC